MHLIDTHCHLVSDKLKDFLPDILARAKQAGVDKIINIAYDPASVLLLQEQLKMSDMLYGTVGIQPHDASTFTPQEAEKMRDMAIHNPKIVGIGEIGLDAYYTLSPMEKQIECFEYFLQMALDLNLPVVVHVRETHGEVLSRLQEFTKRGLKGVIHCFTGTLAEAKDFLSCGLFISLSGIVTFKNAVELKEVARYVPEDRILIETDSPYLSPVPLRGKINEPAHVLHTCNFISDLRKIPADMFAEISFKNAENLFNKLKIK